jgi:uncharacterized membrane protein
VLKERLEGINKLGVPLLPIFYCMPPIFVVFSISLAKTYPSLSSLFLRIGFLILDSGCICISTAFTLVSFGFLLTERHQISVCAKNKKNFAIFIGYFLGILIFIFGLIGSRSTNTVSGVIPFLRVYFSLAGGMLLQLAATKVMQKRLSLT